MKLWCYYDSQTGMFSRKKNSTPDDKKPVAPEGFTLIEGDFDPLSQRFDIQSGMVVDYQPDAPDADHEWNAQTRRWQKRADVREREERRAVALNRIVELERQSWRPMRELAIAASAEAAQRLAEIDAQIVELRQIITDGTERTAP